MVDNSLELISEAGLVDLNWWGREFFVIFELLCIYFEQCCLSMDPVLGHGIVH